MIFRRNNTRPTSVPALREVIFAEIPPRRRVVAAWRRDEASGRVTMVWKLLPPGKKAAG
jgi:hypothetical protein